jgi:hypothetical protein
MIEQTPVESVPAEPDLRVGVLPGGKMVLAMQLIFTPLVWRLMERRKRSLGLA